jgi:hypothetical protein
LCVLTRLIGVCHLELRVKLPSDLPVDRCDQIRYAVSSLLEVWGIPDVCPALIGHDPPVDPAGRCVCTMKLERCETGSSNSSPM